MGEATTGAGVRSFGVSYGLYNLAWGAGLLSGPALGGFLFERVGFSVLMVLWAPLLILARWRLAAVGREGQERQEGQEGKTGAVG